MTPTPIQAGAIPPALEGRDVLGIAQTGTGKTAAFVLPMITRLASGRARARMPRSLVLCPTRELAAQVAENFDKYAKHVKLTKALLIGGVSFKDQDALIDRGVDVLIATPGRLLDHFERGKLLLTGVQIMVVDEADRMLDMGFIPDIERIFGLIARQPRQTLFFSATMAPEIERITKTFLKDPAKVEVARRATTAETIEQGLVVFKPHRRETEASEKRAVLRALIDGEGEACTNAIIFCNRKIDVDIVAKSLKKYGYDAEAIHGDLDQSQRTRTLDAFRDGKLRLLVASDVAARGLDIPAVSHVFNFDVPSHSRGLRPPHRPHRPRRPLGQGAHHLRAPSDEKYLAAIEALIRQRDPAGREPAQGRPAPPRSVPAATRRPRSAAGRRRREDRARRPSASARARPPSRRRRRGRRRAAASPRPRPVAEARREPARAAARAAAERPAPRGASPPRATATAARAASRRDDGVVGMGDDVPSFIRMSFAERRTG